MTVCLLNFLPDAVLNQLYWEKFFWFHCIFCCSLPYFNVLSHNLWMVKWSQTRTEELPFL